MTVVTTLIKLPYLPALRRVSMPHHTQLMPLIEATLECSGKVIVMPENSHESYSCKTITYLALGHLVEARTTVIIG
jgi:hypothetical protein